MELADLNGRWAYITDDWPFDICGILDDASFIQISQHQEPWDGNEITVRVGTKQIDLRDMWLHDLYLCGRLERPSDQILNISGLVEHFQDAIGLKLIPDRDLTHVYASTDSTKEERQKIWKLKLFREPFGKLKERSFDVQKQEMVERRRRMIDYRHKKFGIQPNSKLNEFI